MPVDPVRASDLEVERTGSGPVVLFVHGSIVDARRTWRQQSSLGAHWTLCMPNRPGFAASPPLARGDFELEAPLIADLLLGGAHLVGHSYGAVIALLAAAARPEAVRSLIVSEPGLLRAAVGIPEVDALLEGGEHLYRMAGTMPASEFLRAFRSGVHSSHETPDQLPQSLEQGVKLAARERPPWEADIPFEKLARAAFPKLVISGGHSPAFEAVCNTVADRIGATRAIVAGRGHTIPSVGGPYNALVHEFLTRAEASAPPMSPGA